MRATSSFPLLPPKFYLQSHHLTFCSGNIRRLWLCEWLVPKSVVAQFLKLTNKFRNTNRKCKMYILEIRVFYGWIFLQIIKLPDYRRLYIGFIVWILNCQGCWLSMSLMFVIVWPSLRLFSEPSLNHCYYKV